MRLLRVKNTSILAMIGSLYIRILAWSTKTEYISKGELPSGPFIYAFWHSRLMPLVFSHKAKSIHVLISTSADGETISRIIRNFGFKTIRGSSSNYGSRSAIKMMHTLKDRKICAVTPDGPRGPKNIVKKGLPYMACRTGYPVVPIGCSVKRKIFLNSWDRFLLPLPFSKTVVVTGQPFYVSQEEDLNAVSLKIKTLIDETTSAADRFMAFPERRFINSKTYSVKKP